MDFDGQLPDEEVVFTFRRHPVVMRKGFLLVGLAVVLGALAGLFKSGSATTMGGSFVQFFGPVLISLVIGSVGFMYYWIGWHYSMCIVTNKRFLQIQQTGIFKKRSVNDISLGRILSVNYEVSGMMETLLGFGTIIIQTLVGDFVIRKVAKPARTQAHIVAAITESGVKLNEEVPEVE